MAGISESARFSFVSVVLSYNIFVFYEKHGSFVHKNMHFSCVAISAVCGYTGTAVTQ